MNIGDAVWFGKPKLNRAWGAIRGVLKDFSFNQIKDIAGKAGLDITLLSNLQQERRSTKGRLLSELDRMIGEPKPDDEVDTGSLEDRNKYLKRIAEIIIAGKPDQEKILEEYLERLGWQFTGGHLVPIELLNEKGLEDLPESTHKDLGKAADRLWIGDLDGAMTAACGAVDSTMKTIIEENGIAITSTDGFQNKYRKALNSKGTMEKLKNGLIKLGWDEKDAEKLVHNLQGSLNHAVYVMQSLRTGMGDTHGPKGVLNPTVFDSIKWASQMLRMLKQPPLFNIRNVIGLLEIPTCQAVFLDLYQPTKPLLAFFGTGSLLLHGIKIILASESEACETKPGPPIGNFDRNIHNSLGRKDNGRYFL